MMALLLLAPLFFLVSLSFRGPRLWMWPGRFFHHHHHHFHHHHGRR